RVGVVVLNAPLDAVVPNVLDLPYRLLRRVVGHGDGKHRVLHGGWSSLTDRDAAARARRFVDRKDDVHRLAGFPAWNRWGLTVAQRLDDQLELATVSTSERLVWGPARNELAIGGGEDLVGELGVAFPGGEGPALEHRAATGANDLDSNRPVLARAGGALDRADGSRAERDAGARGVFRLDVVGERCGVRGHRRDAAHDPLHEVDGVDALV